MKPRVAQGQLETSNVNSFELIPVDASTRVTQPAAHLTRKLQLRNGSTPRKQMHTKESVKSNHRTTTHSSDVRAVLKPIRLASHSLRNRAVVAPMSRVSATEDGLATSRMSAYYGAFARGGFGMVISEGTYTDVDASQGYDRQPGIATPAQTEAWRAVARSIHSGGALAILQLMHAGALSQRTLHGGRLLAPSTVRPRGKMMPEYGGNGTFRMPVAMSDRDIQSVRDGFVIAARRARDAGFDGVEVHAANGYLLDQFITTYTNQRSDRYGGSPKNRIRLTAEIVEAIRRETDDAFVIGVRLSEAKVNDFEYRWPEEHDDAVVFFSSLASVGPDYLHLAGEGRGFRGLLERDTKPLTAIAREITGRPVIANGDLGDPQLADEVIENGYADLIAIGRSALANPDWPQRVGRGEPLHPFTRELISPSASLANSDRWLRHRIRASGPAGGC